MNESALEAAATDLSEKGRREGRPISLDRRLYMKFTAFNGCASEQDAADALAAAGVAGALYLDANDPTGIGVVAMTEQPEFLVETLRETFNRPPFSRMTHKAEFDMLGRTYSIGYEADLEHTLLAKPRSRILNPTFRWAVWYPLRRSKRFHVLSPGTQRRILEEHGAVGRRYGAAGLAADIRLACHGLDRRDNDFVIGLLGPDILPLSAVVQEMRTTEQTSRHLASLGPFFVGRTVWQGGGA